MEDRKQPPLWTIAGFLLGLILIFYWKILFTGAAMFPWDAADYFYPAFAFVHEELRHLRMPLWDPYVLSGYPIIGDIQAQIFYPVNWLFVLLNPLSPLPYRLVEMQEILHFFLAGFFMYLLARDFVDRTAAGLLGGVLYMFSGAMVARTQHVNAIDAMAWSPLIFLLARRGLLRKDLLYSAAAGFCFGVQLLAGRWQHSVYLGLLLFLYFAYEACAGPLRAKLWPHWIYGLGVIAGLGAALAMVQIVPAYELGFQSVRTYISYWEVSVGNDPRFLWTLFIPNFLGGINGIPQRLPYDLTFNYVFITVPGALLALWGLVETLRRRNYFWLLVLVLFTELALGNQGHLAGLVYRIPILNLFRTMAAFFEIANLALCLLVAIGAESLLAKELSRRWQWTAAVGLAGLMLAGLAGGFGPLAVNLPSWRHAVAALILFSIIVLTRFANRLGVGQSQWAVVALVVFELWFYNSNQHFNAAPDNPSTFLAADYAVGRKESVEFLRSDRSDDFRVAALAEYQWTGNGWNLWRIPGITGVNPVALRRYDQYMTLFSHILNVRVPTGGEDHNANSPLADLLGVKYLVLANPERETALGLGAGSKYERVFEDNNWWRIYRNDRYFKHAWFYPRAYVLPDRDTVFALLRSSWFDPRQILLLEREAFPAEAAERMEELTPVELFPGGTANITGAAQMSDPYCAQPISMIGGWGRSGSQIRFALPAGVSPGRYRLLVRYTSNELDMFSLGLEMISREHPWYRTAVKSMPLLQASFLGETGTQSLEPVSLPRTFGWPCHQARSADLGELSLDSRARAVTITSIEDSALNLYSAILVRIPDEIQPPAGQFSFNDFTISATRIEFNTEVSDDGFLLLNEIYSPGWEAWIDGQPARIFPADGVFRALYLAAGSHHIEFQFRPRHFYWGAAVSLLAAGLSLSYLDRSLRIRKLARQAGATSDSAANLSSDPTSDPNSNSARGPSRL